MGEKLERRTGEKSTKQDILKGVHLFFADVLSDFVLCLLEFYGVHGREKRIFFARKSKRDCSKIKSAVDIRQRFCFVDTS